MSLRAKWYRSHCRNSRQSIRNPYTIMWVLLCIIYRILHFRNTKRSQDLFQATLKVSERSGRMKSGQPRPLNLWRIQVPDTTGISIRSEGNLKWASETHQYTVQVFILQAEMEVFIGFLFKLSLELKAYFFHCLQHTCN